MKDKILLAVTLLFTQLLFGQALMPLGDLNPGAGNSIPSGSFPNTRYEPGIFVDETLIFSGYDTISGLELFRYDGENIELIKDIRSGSGTSNPIHYQKLNDLVLFIAYDTIHGYEWWRTDGTEAGTQLIKDIYPGKESGVTIDESAAFKVIGNYLYFAGEDEENNAELWRTDGTEEGTSLVKNIGEDFTSFNTRSYPTDFYEFNGQLVFNTINDGFWISDGSEEGTIQLSGGNFFNFADLGSHFIYQSSGLYKSDGTPENTLKYTDVASSTYYNYPGNRFASVGDVVVFPSRDEVHGDELWRTDGTAEGTYLLKDVYEGSDGYPPQNFVNVDGIVYYRGKSGSAGTELFKTDGTADGTGLAVNFVGGSSSGLAVYSKIIKGNGYIVVYRGNSTSLHITYGNNDLLERVELPGDLQHPPKNFYAYQDKLLFYAYSESTGYEPYLLDITRLFTPADDDMDGFAEDIDCDDSNASINPDQVEIPYNGLDDDCNSETKDDDLDNDGFANDLDCDDEDATINPDAVDIPDNNIDENCDGEDTMTSSTSNIALKNGIFPNPVSEILYLHQPSLVEIYNVNGQLIRKTRQASVQVNVSILETGLYIIKITETSESKLYRFAKI